MLSIALLAFLGLCIGSFLLCQAQRWKSPRKSLFSCCDGCGQVLSWYHLIPLASWLIQRRVSACCKFPLSPSYPLVEIFTSGLMIAFFYVFYPEVLIYQAAALVLIWLALVDWYWQEIPISGIIIFAALTALHAWGNGFSLSMLVAYTLLMSGICVSEKIGKRTLLGLGDKIVWGLLSFWLSIECLPIFLISAGLLGVMTPRRIPFQATPFMPALFISWVICLLAGKFF